MAAMAYTAPLSNDHGRCCASDDDTLLIDISNRYAGENNGGADLSVADIGLHDGWESLR